MRVQRPEVDVGSSGAGDREPVRPWELNQGLLKEQQVLLNLLLGLLNCDETQRQW